MALAGAVVFPAPPVGAGPAHAPGGLSLVAPPPVVTPAQPTLLLRLRLPGGIDRNVSSLQLTLYRCLGSRSAFDQTLAAAPTGTAASGSGTVRVSSLVPDPADPSGAVDLAVPVHAGNSSAPSNGAFTANLSCPQSHYGVYPLRVAVSDGGSPVGQLLTYVVYTDPAADTQPLRLALVVPLQVPPSSPSPTGSRPPPSAAQVARLQALVGALSASRVPLTLLPDAATASALVSGAQPKDRQALAQVAALAAAPGHQVLCGPFTNVDPNDLLASGLESELSAQMRQGTSVLEGALHANCSGPRAWVAQQALGQPALSALDSLGVRQVVVPQSTVSGPSCSSTCTRLFDLGDSRTDSLPAAAVDPGLSAHIQSSSRADPALAAQQAVAELEQIYFDAPNTPDPRGVVVVAPADWGAVPAFVSDLLALLQGNPMVRATTLSELFAPPPAGVAVGGTIGGVTQPSSRRPAGGSGSSTLPARAIRAERSRLTSFAAAVSQSPPGAAVAQQLDQLLLLAESGSLGDRQQRSALTGADDALQQQLRSFTVNASTIRLASEAAPVPITVVKGTPYAVNGVLGVRSDKLAFPSGAQSPGGFCRSPSVESSAGRSSFSSFCVIGHSTNVIYVNMRTRATGNFRVSVTLTSPSGGLVLASGQLTVRAMSISAGSIALSVGAAAVLLAWWGQTVWRRRHGRGPRRRTDGHRTQAAT